MESRTITIAETVQQNVGGDYISEPKTESSYRTLPTNDEVFDYLKDLKKKQEERQRILGSDYQDSDYVCVREDGKLIKPNYIDRVYSHVLKKSSLPYIRFHDLRHSLASNSLNNGLSITQVQAWLGHSTPATTLKYYSHINSSDKLDMAQVLKKLYGSSDKV